MEELQCTREVSNDKNRYAVTVMKGYDIVGHVPRRISATCSLFLRRGSRIEGIIMATSCFSANLPEGGLEIPCILRFKGEPKDNTKPLILTLKKSQPEMSQPVK